MKIDGVSTFNVRFLVLIFLFINFVSYAQSRQEKKERETGISRLLKNDYSDTLYTYLDEKGKALTHEIFWVRAMHEKWGVVKSNEKTSRASKQFSTSWWNGLIDFKVNFDSLNYTYSGKRPENLKGKPVVMVNWLPGCYGCSLLEKDLIGLRKIYPEVVFVHVAEKSWGDMKKWMLKYGLEDVLVLNKDFHKENKSRFTWAAPTTLFIDRNGVVRDYFLGCILSMEQHRNQSLNLFIRKIETVRKSS